MDNNRTKIKNIVISGTNFWNPGDDFVRDGIIRILKILFKEHTLNFLFYNFNQDFYPQSKFSGIHNMAAAGDLEKYCDFVDAVVIAGLSAGKEIKDLYNWIIENGLLDRVYLIGAGYANTYVAKSICQEPEATIFKNARVITGRTEKKPSFITELGLPYHHINCPAMLSVENVKDFPAQKAIETIGFSIQLPHRVGIVNQSCEAKMYQLAAHTLLELSSKYNVEIIAHHKEEYFHFLNLVKGRNIPVFFSSFYEDLFDIYRRYDLVISTRLHSCIYANSHGIPAIIINDTDRHTHCAKGFPHLVWVNTKEKLYQEFGSICGRNLSRIAKDNKEFKDKLMQKYLTVLAKPFGVETRLPVGEGIPVEHSNSKVCRHFQSKSGFTQQPAGKDEITSKLFRSVCNDTNAKLRVLNTISQLTKDHWLEGNIEMFKRAVDSNASWFETLSFLNWYATNLKPSNYLEVGVRRGRSQAQVLVQSPETKVYGFDIWAQEYAGVPNPGPDFVVSELKKLGVKNLPTLIVGNSHETLPRFWSEPDNPRQFELILVDGDHSYQGAKKDLEICFAHLAPGGALLFDDIRHPTSPWLKDLWEEYKNKFSDYIFIEHSQGCGTGVAFKPPFTKLKMHLDIDKQEVKDNKPNVGRLAQEKVETVGQIASSLSIHFFTIVLNGQPFIRHHIEVFKQLPFKWNWHIIEGVAELKHDTAWSVKLGGRINEQLHSNGLSNDGTTEYLDELKNQFPDNVTIYRKANGAFWDGKLEMVNAPLANINEECLLWQVDSDELWTEEQICASRDMFIAEPDRTAAYYLDNFFVGENLVTTTINTYGNNTSYEWLRTWRFNPSLQWAAHEPPRLCMPAQDGKLVDIATIKPFKHHETQAKKLVFQHYAYATEKQLAFKEIYYGYKNAVEQWRHLQQHKDFPVFLRDYFGWVKDGAQVNTILSQNIIPIARKDANNVWQFSSTNTFSEQQFQPSLSSYKRVLIVRSDSIGDFVIFADMLKYFRDLYPEANISVLLREHIAELAETCPHIDEVIKINATTMLNDKNYTATLVDYMKEQRFDITLYPVYSRDKIGEFITINSGAKEKIAFCGDSSNLSLQIRQDNDQFYTKLLPSESENKSELERDKDFLRGLGVESPSLAPKVWITDDDKEFAEEFFKNNNLKPTNTIAVFPVAQYPYKVYTNYEPVLEKLRDSNFNFVILGGKDAQQQANQICTKFPEASYNLAGRTSLRQMAAVISKCRLYLGSDSAGAHIACAVGTPNVVILGGGHFGRFLPYSPLTSTVSLPLDCYGCNWRCRYQQNHCVKDIVPEVVEEALLQTLAKTSVKPRIFLQGDSLWEPVQGQPFWKPAEGFLEVGNFEIITVERRTAETPENRYNLESFTKSNNENMNNFGQFESAEEHENKYLVTAIVSTYNSERFIRDCLEDLENQTIADKLEIIVVNSGSQQNEEAVVKEFQSRYDNIKYIRTEERETIYKAWNRAIKVASGKYITNANTDDKHTEDALGKMAMALEQNPDKVLVYMDQNKVTEEDGRRVAAGNLIRGKFSRSRLFNSECVPGSQPMWRKSVHDVFGYFDEEFVVSGDYEFWFRLTQKFDFLYLDKTLGERFVSPDIVGIANMDLLSWENEMVIHKCYEYALQEDIIIGATGISKHQEFSNWPEVNIWKQNTKAKLEDRQMSLVDNIKDTWDHRTNPAPKLTFVVVTYNRHKELLENLYALNEQNEKDFEVIVVDNGGDLPWLRQHTDEFKFGLCGVELEYNFGPSPARNIGAEFAKAEYIAFLDDDAVADKDLVRNIVEHFKNHNISGLRGKVLPKSQAGSEDIPVNYDLGDQIITTACEVSCLSAFRKDVLVKTGGFDEFLFGPEGMELSYRICKAQKEKTKSILYFPDVIVYHDHRSECPAQTEKTPRQERMERLAWRKDNNLTGYKEHIHSLYPGSKDVFENYYNNYSGIINIAIYLSNTFPEEAVEWAKKAVTLDPSRFKGCYILGSLYTGFGRYDEALPLLERTYELLCNSVMSDRNEFVGSEFDEQVDISECYIKTCTQLAQCYMQTNQYDKLKQIYTDLLNNPNLTIPEEQKTDICNVLTKLDRTPPTSVAVAAENKNKSVISAKSEQGYLVSAIVSTYNSEKFLSGCLEDLEHQTIADKLEIIIVNSGSQENEEAIVHEYQQKYDNIVYLKTERREGIYTAWNRAVKVARGSFLTNANTDDRHREDALEIMAEMLLANPDAALVYGDQICTDTSNGTFANHHATNMAKRPEYSLERLLFGCCVGSQPMWRKPLHTELGYFDDTLTCAGDWDFWLRISSKYKFKHIPEFLGLYYYNENGIEHGKKIHSLYERYIVGKRYGNPYISVIPLYASKDNPLVSVIMPAYNATEHIAETIESVLIQNYRNFELIVVDDGSTDNTRNIITSFKNDKIKYFYKDNGGPSGARNLALSKTMGQYIIPLDADDMITPDFIAKHLQEFEKHPEADLVYCDDYLIDENSNPIRVIKRPEYINTKLLIRDLFHNGFPIVPFRTCFRRSVLDKIGLFDEELLVGEDYDMIRRFVRHGLKMHHLQNALYLRRMTSDSLSRNYSAQKAKCHFEVIRRFTDTFTYDELFPDVAWDQIEPGIKQLHAKCLTAGNYLALGQEYIKSNALEYSRTAFDRACSELNDCIKIDPKNQDLQQLLQKSKHLRARYTNAAQQAVTI
ncbi:MAG: glycosyltransferase [Planctomycetes bacterium]|nr:glycosyltransferase [Planctomycetota bacterium]